MQGQGCLKSIDTFSSHLPDFSVAYMTQLTRPLKHLFLDFLTFCSWFFLCLAASPFS